jgi:UDP-N-acetylglucosamine 2-epimerase (non-hydrolysing)
LVSAHREENISNENSFKSLIESLNHLALNFKFPIIVSTHPRTRNKLNELNLQTDPLIQFLEPLGFIDYNSLQKNAFVVLSDSGTISEESSILNFRALNIREAHERPEAMEEAAVMMVGLQSQNIIRGVEEVMSQHTAGQRNYNLVSDYSKPNVSSKVVRIILSYTSYINRVVWQKQ